MSLASLDQDSLRHLLAKVSLSEVCKLINCGNSKLRAQLSRTVRIAFFDWNKRSTLPLADLILASKRLLTTQEGFEIAFKDPSSQFLLDDGIPWDLFPSELKSFKLPLDLEVPPPRLLSELFLQLETLEIGTIKFEIPSPSTWLPKTLTSLSLVGDGLRKNPYLEALFSHLPPTLTHIDAEPDIYFTGKVASLTHLTNLEHLECTLYAIEPFDWTIFPSSITTLKGHFGQVESTTGYSHPKFLRPPKSWSAHFPRLVALGVRFESLCEYKLSGCFDYDLPPSFTSLSVYGLPPIPSWIAAVKFTTLLARRFGPRLRYLNGLYESYYLVSKYFYNLNELATGFGCPYTKFDTEEVEHGNLYLETNDYEGTTDDASYDDQDALDEGKDDATIYRELKARQDDAMTFLSQRPLARTLYLGWLPDADKLSLLPPNLTDLTFAPRPDEIVTDRILTAPSYKIEDWPKYLTSLKFEVDDFPRDEEKPLNPFFDFDCLPRTLQSLHVQINLKKHPQRLTFHTLLKGKLSHLDHLQRLKADVCWKGMNVSELDSYVTSPLDLPASLTSLVTSYHFISESVIYDAWDADRKQSRFDQLKTLDISIPNAIEESSFKFGTNTSIVHHLPASLTSLSLSCHPESAAWDETFFKALPRSLTYLELERMFAIPFANDDGSCVKYLPKSLDSFIARCQPHREREKDVYDHSRCVPKSMIDNFPFASRVTFPRSNSSAAFERLRKEYRSKH